LLSHLDMTAAMGRTADAIRPDRDPRIPKLEHVISYEWRPPPTRDEVLKTVSPTDCCRRFNRTTKNSGDVFRKDAILRHPKEFTSWEVGRICNATPDRSIKNPPGKSGVTRYHQQSEAIEPPTDKMLHPQHGKWLQTHYVQRERHLYPVYHALKRIEKAEVKAKEMQQKRELTRDVMTRGALTSSGFSPGVKSKLAKAKMAISSTRAFNKLSGIDVVAEEEQKNNDLLLRARSDPALRLKPLTPRHRPRHIRTWKGPERRLQWSQIDLRLAHTTPGLEQEEEHELHSDPRFRVRGA